MKFFFFYLFAQNSAGDQNAEKLAKEWEAFESLIGDDAKDVSTTLPSGLPTSIPPPTALPSGLPSSIPPPAGLLSVTATKSTEKKSEKKKKEESSSESGSEDSSSDDDDDDSDSSDEDDR